MKKILSVLPYLLSMFLIISFTACGSDDEETCDDTPLSQCPAAVIATCCPDNADCYYIYNGDKYDTTSEIVALCNPSGSAAQLLSMQLELDNYTKQLLDEARSAALCQ